MTIPGINAWGRLLALLKNEFAMTEPNSQDLLNLEQLAVKIKNWASELGFQETFICDVDISHDAEYFRNWLAKNYHGEMDYMQRHAELRANPHLLEQGTLRSICVRMDYYDRSSLAAENILNQSDKAYISRYALGRDYHKLIRKRLAVLAERIKKHASEFTGRAFVDSAPVLERALAQRSGMGWIGKNTMLMNERAGSWFFLGELFTNLALPIDEPQTSMHCGSCRSCIDACPTQAIVAPFQVDARRCISYLTIELKTSIPEEFRQAMGNRVFGCDDCQLVCPFNKFAGHSQEDDFNVRHQLDNRQLAELFLWDEATFLKKTEGSAIRRIGYHRWLRNLAIGLGNSKDPAAIAALKQREDIDEPMVREHIEWALKELSAE